MMKLSDKSLKIVKTCNLYLSFIAVGLYVAVLGPCLLDLRDLVKTDTKQIGIIYTARSIGFIVGSILTGIILDATKYKQAVMTICNIIGAAALLTIPWSINLGMLSGCIFVSSTALSIVLVGGNVLCLTLWGSDSGPYIHALHFVFGLGALVAPLIAAPFLGDRSSDIFSDVFNNTTYATNISTMYNYTSMITDASSIPSIQNVSKIVFPFSIISIYTMLVSVMFLLISIISPTEVEDERVQNEQNSEYNLRFTITILVFNFFFIFVTTGIEIGYAQMLTTYVVNGYLKLLTSVGSYMTSIFWIAFAVSRLAAVLIAIKISHFTIIIINLIVILVGAFILVLLASYEWALWVSSVLLGAGVAPFYAAAMGWMDVYITVTNKMASFLGIAIAIGDMVIPFIIGCYIEKFPDIFIYLIFTACIFSCFIVTLLFLMLRKRQKKCEKTSVEPRSSFVHIIEH